MTTLQCIGRPNEQPTDRPFTDQTVDHANYAFLWQLRHPRNISTHSSYSSSPISAFFDRRDASRCPSQMETLRKTRHDFYITTMARPLCCTCSIALQLLLHCRHCMSVVIISGPIHLLCKLTIRPRNQACSWATVLIPWPSTFAFQLPLGSIYFSYLMQCPVK